jgi:hypothetical protein
MKPKTKCDGCGAKIDKTEIYTDFYYCVICHMDYPLEIVIKDKKIEPEDEISDDGLMEYYFKILESENGQNYQKR